MDSKVKSSSSDRGKFLGDTKGNRDMNINMTEQNLGGSGESHTFSTSGAGGDPTKGNSYLKPDRTTGYDTGYGSDPHKAGGQGKGK